MLLVFGRRPIAEAGAATKIATVCGYREHADVGDLISYGVNLK
jgi:hypothetical protein